MNAKIIVPVLVAVAGDPDQQHATPEMDEFLPRPAVERELTFRPRRRAHSS